MLVLVDYIEVIVKPKRYSRKLIKVLKPIYKDVGVGSALYNNKLIKNMISLQEQNN